MKLKTLKHHYYGNKFMRVGSEYMADRVHGGIVVRNGSCKELSLPSRKDKIEDKQAPETKEGALETKTVAELKILAKETGIERYGSLKKNELISALKK